MKTESRREQLLEALDEVSRHIRAEKEPVKLLHEIVRLATQLTQCSRGCLFINYPNDEHLEIVATHNLPEDIIREQISYQNLVGDVVKTSKVQIASKYPDWAGQDALFQSYNFKSVVGLPLLFDGKVEAVLLVADETNSHKFDRNELEILERFAAQATIALQTSRLMGREQRMYARLAVLYRISDYMQGAKDVDKIIHIVLTGVTASYGLGFNRAVLFLLDQTRESLIGRMGIGYLEEQDARQDWVSHFVEDGLEDFDRYISLLQGGTSLSTPIGELIRELSFSLKEKSNIFVRAILERRWISVEKEELKNLPSEFIQVFKPTTPFIAVPLIARNRAIGLLVADNKFTNAPITEEDSELLMTFANTTAIAIDNVQLFQEVDVTRDHLDRLVASSFDGIITIDISGNMTGFNLRAEQILGYSAKDVLGKSIVDLYYHPLEAQKVDNLLKQSVDGKLTNHLTSVKSKQGDRVPISLSATWLFDSQGDRIGSVAYFRDLRQIQETEMQRQRLLEASNAVVQATNLDEGLQSLSRFMVESCAVTFCSILLLLPDEKSFIVRAAYPISRLEHLDWNPNVGKVYLPPQDVWGDKILMTGKPVILRQGKKHTDKLLGHLSDEIKFPKSLQSILIVPLQTNEKRLGMCILGEMRSWDRNPITEMKIELAQSLTNQTATLIEKMRLYELTQQARDAARVVAQVSVLEDLTHTLNSIVRGTQDALGCDAVTLYTYDQERDEFGFPPALAGIMNEKEVARFSAASNQSVVRKILALESIYVAENASSDLLIQGSFAIREQIKSSVGIPLRVGDRKVGVMFVNYRTSHSFTADEIINIELFANQAAVAIRNAQLLNEIKKRAEALEGLYSAGKVITSTLAVDEVLRRITDEALNIVGTGEAQGCFSHVALFDGTKLKFIAASPTEMLNVLNSIEIDLTKSPKRGIDGQAAVTGVSLNVSNTNSDLEYIPIKENINSQLSVPLKVGGRVIGVLSIEHPDPAAFSDEDVLNVELLASQAAVALQNAQQYEELMQTKDLVGARTALAWMGMVSSTWRHAIEKHAITIRDQTELLRNDLAPSLESDRVDRRLDMIQRLANQILEKPMTAPLSSEEGVESVLVNYLIIERTKQLRVHDPYRNILLETSLELEDTATVRASPEWLRRALDILIDNAADAVSDSRQPKIIITTRSINTGVEIVVSDTGRGIPSEILKELFVVPIPSTNKLGLGLLFAQTIVQTYNGNIFCQETSARGTTMVIWFPRADLKEATATRSTITRFSTSPIEYERLYNELRRAYDELKELDKKKTEFLSTVSHELRTPLTSVKSCIENLLSGMYGFLNEKQQSRLDIALSGAREESRLIENLLDLARIQEGKSVLDLTQGDICKIIRDVAGVFRYDASQKDITITEELPNDEKIEMLVDAGKVKQVITNLVSNALKFTPEEGIITIRARNLDTHVEIQVKDTGIGIPEEEFQKIFDRFYQVDSSLTRKVGGTGIGLNIAKEYVEMHGGRIWVENSKVGEGTIFTFTLPVK